MGAYAEAMAAVRKTESGEEYIDWQSVAIWRSDVEAKAKAADSKTPGLPPVVRIVKVRAEEIEE